MNRRSWQRTVIESVALLLLVAIGAHVVYGLLVPLLPALIAAGCAAFVITAVVRRR
jgi:hypothetical protein